MDLSIKSPLAFLDFTTQNFDPHGDIHMLAVSKHATIMAARLCQSAAEIEWIEVGAKYHDIGKLFIPESIRRFPGLFTPVEQLVMQQHCQIGAQMLQLLGLPAPVVAIALNHQENYDGSGYPSALRGRNIPIGARIVRIVDSFDAVTHDRGYRHACSKKRALEKLHERSTHYDPDLLDLFETLIHETWDAVPGK